MRTLRAEIACTTASQERLLQQTPPHHTACSIDEVTLGAVSCFVVLLQSMDDTSSPFRPHRSESCWLQQAPRLAWFDAVLADIGDAQDLRASLSTFSGHVRRLSGILGTATPASLVVLDEVCCQTPSKLCISSPPCPCCQP